jgi:hypothetical protein
MEQSRHFYRAHRCFFSILSLTMQCRISQWSSTCTRERTRGSMSIVTLTEKGRQYIMCHNSNFYMKYQWIKSILFHSCQFQVTNGIKTNVRPFNFTTQKWFNTVLCLYLVPLILFGSLKQTFSPLARLFWLIFLFFHSLYFKANSVTAF